MYADSMPFWTQIEPTHNRRNDHCKQKGQKRAFQKPSNIIILERTNDVWMTSDGPQLCEL